MRSTEIIQYKLQPALDECRLHHKRLHQAWLEASQFAAFAAAHVTHPLPVLTEEQVRVTDQLVFRFGRLQDTMGARLLPALLQLTQEWFDQEAFIDKLNRAEKLGMIPSADQWLLLRELRNQTAHEYPAQPELVIANMKRLIDCSPQLEQAFEQLQKQASQRIG